MANLYNLKLGGSDKILMYGQFIAFKALYTLECKEELMAHVTTVTGEKRASTLHALQFG